MWQNVLFDAGVITIYSLVGIMLMIIGFLAVDLITPGKLPVLLWEHQSPNAIVLVSSSLLAVAMIVVTAIMASFDDLVLGVVTTFIYGVVGIIVMSLSFLLIDAITPTNIRNMVSQENLTPAVWVNASAYIGIAAIMCAAIY